MKKIKSIKWSVELSYKNTFVCPSINHAAYFMEKAVAFAEDTEDILNFRLIPYVEYEEELDKEAIENEDVHQD